MLPYINLLNFRNPAEWNTKIESISKFIISETPPDTFEERSAEIQEMLITLKVLAEAFDQEAKNTGPMGGVIEGKLS